MKISIEPDANKPMPVTTAPQRGKVVIAANIKKESVVIDKEGNVIDPRTGQIIKMDNPTE